jgi:rare lipoprotein A (peptidoglycan hydrolase)
MPRQPLAKRSAGATALALLLFAAQLTGCGSSGARPQAAPRTAKSTSTGRHAAGRSAKPDPRASDVATAPASGTPPGRDGQRKHHTAPASRPIPPAHPVPAAFRPAPGAPSDEEVRSELRQLDAIERSEHERALSAAAASLAGLLPWSMEPKSGTQVSVASVFRDYGLGLACGGLLGRDQLGVAHKTAPCGTLITFTYGGRSLTVPVIDRGPYIAGREWDLTGATAEALGFPGLGEIAWSVAG